MQLEMSGAALTLPLGSHTPVSPGRRNPSRPDTSRSALPRTPRHTGAPQLLRASRTSTAATAPHTTPSLCTMSTNQPPYAQLIGNGTPLSHSGDTLQHLAWEGAKLGMHTQWKQPDT